MFEEEESGGANGGRCGESMESFFATAVPRFIYAVGGGLNVFCVAFGQNRNASPTILHTATQYFHRSWI